MNFLRNFMKNVWKVPLTVSLKICDNKIAPKLEGGKEWNNTKSSRIINPL